MVFHDGCTPPQLAPDVTAQSCKHLEGETLQSGYQRFDPVAAIVGDEVGLFVGDEVGREVGGEVGGKVGLFVGDVVGVAVVGDEVGLFVGDVVGAGVGQVGMYAIKVHASCHKG